MTTSRLFCFLMLMTLVVGCSSIPKKRAKPLLVTAICSLDESVIYEPLSKLLEIGSSHYKLRTYDGALIFLPISRCYLHEDTPLEALPQDPI